jgi:spore maturation protein SpmA
MGKIWAFLIVVSSMYALFTGRHEQLLDGILSIPQESFDFLIVIL